MSYTQNKQGEIIISGFEQGIAVSPHKGIANIQNANISTESGEVMCSFGRVQQTQAVLSGTLTQTSSTTVRSNTGNPLVVGSWIFIVNSSIANLTANHYYYIIAGTPISFGYSLADGGTSGSTSYFTTNTSIVGSLGSGTATFTSAFDLGKPIAKATETYIDSNQTQQYRYYILDLNGRVWVQDTSSTSVTNVDKPLWFLPYTGISYVVGIPTGMAILNGWLFIFTGNSIFVKSTSRLEDIPRTFVIGSGPLGGVAMTTRPHFAYVGHQGKLYYTDGNFIGSIFPNIGGDINYTAGVNIQSYSTYTASSTTGTITTIIGGSLPVVNSVIGTRIPAVLFCDGKSGSLLPSDVISKVGVDGQCWIKLTSLSTFTFEAYVNPTGGSPMDLQTGAVGAQFFNTFYPISIGGSNSGGITMQIFTPQRLNLPFFETSQSITEISNTIVIGTQGNTIYPWNQVDPLPSDIITLPENNVSYMTTVNNMAYIFAGFKGNIYLTNGSTASLVTTVPDYCAGVAGTPSSYIEPYFIWGGADYIRGRVYFSILDQTSTKTGNCGGVWSFVPTQNFFVGQDTGLSLRLENQNSYGTYNGYATIILGSQQQNAKSPQYWAGWQSTYTGTTYGIDFTNTTPSSAATFETDLIPTGTLFNKETMAQVEYKLASPLAVGESVAINFRLNGTDAYTPCGTANVESTTGLSGVFTANFEKTQWIQLKGTLNALTTTSTSYVRLKEIIIRENA